MTNKKAEKSSKLSTFFPRQRGKSYVATLASGTWDTLSKPRPKYKVYDTTIYQLEAIHKFTVSGIARIAINDPPQILRRFFTMEEKGKSIKNIVKDPEVIWQNDALTQDTQIAIMAYVKPEDLMVYKLTYGVE